MGGKLIELYCEAEKNGVDVDWVPMMECESLSVELSDGSMAIAIDPWKMDTIAKESVCLAHELGHCETGSFYNPYTPFDVVKKHENRADKWAIKKLVPEEEFRDQLESGNREVWCLADHFGVTEDFIKKAVCYYTYGDLNTGLYF